VGVFFAGYQLGVMQTQNSAIIIEPRSFTETASYIIFGEDTNNDGIMDIIYAKNGKTGEIDFHGTDAATVIQNAIDALKVSYGARYKLTGKIFLKAGSYELKKPLNLTNVYNIQFEGEGGINEEGQTQLLIATNNIGFDLTGARFCTFRNLVFKTQTGYTPKAHILLARDSSGESAGDHVFDRCTFYGDAEYGLIYNYGSEFNEFRECVFFSKRRALILTESNILGITSPYVTIATGDQSMLQNFFDDCIFDRPSGLSPTGETILMNGGGSHVFTKCFVGGGTLYFIKIDFSNNDNVNGVVIRETNFESMLLTVDAQTASKYIFGWRIENVYFGYSEGGVYIDCNKENVLFSNGIIRGVRALWGKTCEFRFWRVYRSIIDVRGSVTPITLTINVIDASKIIGYKDYTSISSYVGNLNIVEYIDALTKNSGIATGLSNGAYIAHGLVDVPSVVVLTCLNATYDGVPVIVSWNQALTNSTHIAVNIYWANGTAIADPVIAVSWYAEV